MIRYLAHHLSTQVAMLSEKWTGHMAGVSPFALLDPALAPRAGQRIMLDYYGKQTEGIVQRMTGATLEARVASPSFLGSLHRSAHVRAQVVVPNGLMETVLTRLAVQGDIVTGQIVGAPTHVQRRAAPRVNATLPAHLAWFDGPSGSSLQATGMTHNVSVGGALLSFDESCPSVPEQVVAALLALQLPNARHPMALPVRVVQAWDGGARVQIVDATPHQIKQLSSFVEARE